MKIENMQSGIDSKFNIKVSYDDYEEKVLEHESIAERYGLHTTRIDTGGWWYIDLLVFCHTSYNHFNIFDWNFLIILLLI